MVEFSSKGQPPGPGKDRCNRIRWGRITFPVLPVVTRNRTMGRFRLHGFAVRSYQSRGHQSQRPETLGQSIWLYIPVIIFTGPDKTSLPLQGGGDHIVNKSVLINNPKLIHPDFIVLLIHFFKNILKPAVIFFQDCVFSGQVEGPFFIDSLIKTRVGKTVNWLIRIIHGHGYAITPEVIHLKNLRFAPVLGGKGNSQSPFSFHHEISGPVLISKCMSADTDRFFPGCYQPRHIFYHYRLSENSTSKNITNGSIGGSVHSFQAKFLHPILIRSNGGTLYSHPCFQNCMGSINCDLIVCFIPFWNTQVIVLDLKIKIWKNKFIFYKLPDNASHFIAIQLYYRVFNFNFFHFYFIWLKVLRTALCCTQVTGNSSQKTHLWTNNTFSIKRITTNL